MNIALLGPPGSGKGTLAASMAAASLLGIFDTGATLRTWSRKNDPALYQHLSAGGMAPTDLVIDLMGRNLANPPAGCRGWIIDGFPRNEEQANIALSSYKAGKFSWDALLILDSSTETVISRLAGRQMCGSCGKAWNTRFLPPVTLGRCSCGGALAPRADDTEEGIAQRLSLYTNRTSQGIARILADGNIPVVKLDGNHTEPQRTWHEANEWLEKSFGARWTQLAVRPEPNNRRGR